MIVGDDVVLPRRLWAELVTWRAGYRCEDCGRAREELRESGQSGRLHAHHCDEDKANNRLANGRCLCPSCHLRHHRRTFDPPPCDPNCACGKHRRHDGVYAGSKPCAEGCECGRHKPPAVPFSGGINRCPKGCTCRRHVAMIPFRGPRAVGRPCSECGRVARKITRGRCPACYIKTLRSEGRVGGRAA